VEKKINVGSVSLCPLIGRKETLQVREKKKKGGGGKNKKRKQQRKRPWVKVHIMEKEKDQGVSLASTNRKEV